LYQVLGTEEVMKILIDNTISKVAKVSLFDKDKLLSQKEGTDALVLVNELLKENKLDLKDVLFELKNEPGSYTGLKIGASLINALNFARGKKGLVIPKY
jgi:tRNA A37 threonylcarbamoyladenosine modification protein TsaB